MIAPSNIVIIMYRTMTRSIVVSLQLGNNAPLLSLAELPNWLGNRAYERSLRGSGAVEELGRDFGALGKTRYSINRQMQKETCRHSAVIFTITEPQTVQ
jgi:hypothetical protein